MSDVDKSSKTEPPTEKKLSEARAKGNHAKAPEISMTFTLLAGFVIILFYAPGKAEDIAMFTRSIFENLDAITATQEGVAHYLGLGCPALALGLLGCRGRRRGVADWLSSIAQGD